jgi:RNA polymerase sigma factor (sigma-70 family)
VLRHLRFLTGDGALAEDIAQETFGKLLQLGPEEAAALRDPRAWLMKVASNLAYNHFRGETRRVVREQAIPPGRTVDLDEVVEVRRTLLVLEPRERAVLLLRHSGFSYAEIAEAIDVKTGSIGTVLARARRRFREVYEGPQSGPDSKGW